MTRDTCSRISLVLGSVGVAGLAAEDVARLTAGGLFVGSSPLLIALASAAMLGIGALTSRRGDRVTLVGTIALLLHVLVRLFGRGVIGMPTNQTTWVVTALALAVPLLIVVAGVIAARTTGRRSWQVLGVGLVTGGMLWFAGSWYPTAHLLLFVIIEFVSIALVTVLLCWPAGGRVISVMRQLWSSAAVR